MEEGGWCMWRGSFANWDIKQEVLTLSNNHIRVFFYATLISWVHSRRLGERGSWQRSVSPLHAWWSVCQRYACLKLLSPCYLLNSKRLNTEDKKLLRLTTCWAKMTKRCCSSAQGGDGFTVYRCFSVRLCGLHVPATAIFSMCEARATMLHNHSTQ